ncbi:hypothetical protein VIGAN_11047000 [Vigna angularis var. angularis]|uniref:Uncharacterized protein n=1 Tax=Vigna angularis var. angularis TaxID=157739 RepID=A0A0S3T8E7_PHAAN|nr:hypothetical protein VIGAN_11047000 [Vigna angularis var. angularis]
MLFFFQDHHCRHFLLRSPCVAFLERGSTLRLLTSSTFPQLPRIESAPAVSFSSPRMAPTRSSFPIIMPILSATGLCGRCSWTKKLLYQLLVVVDRETCVFISLLPAFSVSMDEDMKTSGPVAASPICRRSVGRCWMVSGSWFFTQFLCHLLQF